MRVKTYPIQVWFLQSDLLLSAQQLPDKLLTKSITGCMNALICARFYFIGIRNQKIYSYFFSKEQKQETLDRFFPLWPLSQKPAFNTYKTRLSKWTRMCQEHYNYILSYLEILLLEYEFRKSKQSSVQKFLEWEKIDAPKLQIPIGNIKQIVVPWKVLNPKYRDIDILNGYRKQCKAFMENDGLNVDSYTKRDIPEWMMSESMKNHWLS